MNKKSKIPRSDDEIINLVNAIKDFDKTTVTLNNAYRKLEKRVEELDVELAEANEELSREMSAHRKIRNYLSNILESLTSGVIVTDTENRITIINRMAQEITGISASEAINQDYDEVIANEWAENEKPIFACRNDVVISGKEKYLTTHRKEIPLRYSISPVVNDEGEIAGAVEVFENISEIRELENEVTRHRTLVALGEMAANVAHEIRNPLGGMVGFLSLLRQDLKGDESKLELVSRVMEGLNNLSRITSDVLMFSRYRTPNLQMTELKDFLRNECYTFQVLMEQKSDHTEIELILPEESMQVEIDTELFRQMLLNMFINAANATKDRGGNLTVELHWNLFHNEFKIRISDDGEGMDEETQDKIFNPFFTTHDQGTGLGMAIVKKVIDVHKGKINLKSAPDEGTEFLLSFPMRHTENIG